MSGGDIGTEGSRPSKRLRAREARREQASLDFDDCKQPLRGWPHLDHDPPTVIELDADDRAKMPAGEDRAHRPCSEFATAPQLEELRSKAHASSDGHLTSLSSGRHSLPAARVTTERPPCRCRSGTLGAIPTPFWCARVACRRHLGAGPKRAAYAAALIERCDAEFVNPILNEVITNSDDTFDVIEVVAEHDTDIAFGSIDEARWHQLSPEARDHLMSLLEQHATADEEDLLDLIAGDSEAANSGRRARAAYRWSELATLHGDIPAGVFSLLDSARPDLNQAFAKVAMTVQPRDDHTLLRLREKWIQGGKIGDDARTALDAVATGVIETLGALTGPARRSEGPDLLRILGLTAAEDSFESLISHVGADAIDDDLGLRRAAAAAVRTFVDATRLDPERLAALGAGAASEPDAEASDHLREALAAARMGEDAAILLLYELAGLAAADVTATPNELFGEQKPRLLLALKRLVVQRELGEAKGFDAPSVHLQSLHDMRSNRTAAHHPNGGPLDEDAVRGAVNALETAARDIIIRLQNDGPLLRAVETTP